jgi:glutathione S-transferase
MGIDFYWTPGGPFAWRCLLTLEAKRLPYTSRTMQLSKGETRTPEFLALNPRGTLPVLKDGAVVVRESQAIMFYLERAYPDAPLYGRTPAEAAIIMQEICEHASYIEPLLRGVIGPLLFGQTAALPNVGATMSSLESELQKLADRLMEQTWLAGEGLSAADLNLFPFLPTLQRALNTPEAARSGLTPVSLAQRYPAIKAWMGRIEALPGYERTISSLQTASG